MVFLGLGVIWMIGNAKIHAHEFICFGFFNPFAGEQDMETFAHASGRYQMLEL